MRVCRRRKPVSTCPAGYTCVRAEPVPAVIESCAEVGGEQEAAIRAQLGRVLASAPFKNSRQYPALLKYVVEQNLKGGGPRLKERALGIAVFGRREPDYDTKSTRWCGRRHARYGNGWPSITPRRAGQRRSGSNCRRDRICRSSGHPSRGICRQEPRHREARRSVSGTLWQSGEPVTICVSAPYDPDGAAVTTADPTYLEVMRSDRMAFADALTMARLTGIAREFVNITRCGAGRSPRSLISRKVRSFWSAGSIIRGRCG